MEVIKKDLKDIEQMVIENSKKIDENARKIDNNVERIIKNMNKLHKHEEKINGNSNKIQENSYALDILKDYKRESKRLFTALIVTLCMWFITIGYLIYTIVK